MTNPSLADLHDFGPPIYVPSYSPWWVAGVEHSAGKADGVVVFGDNGAIEIRTESVSRPEQPLSIRVQNVQMASASQQSLTPEWQRIIVSEVEQSVVVAGVERPVRVLKSGTRFSFETQTDERVVRAAGMLGKLADLELVRLDDPTLAG